MSTPKPLTPAGCDLRDFPHTPLFRSRLFGSSFHARATDSEWRAGVTLWLKSWDQVPAGSLPNDDIELTRLAELARDTKQFAKLKDGALRGWVLCDDGRLYHPVVAEGVNNAIEHKAKQRAKTAKARIAALEKHLKDAQSQDDIDRITDEIEKIRQSVSQVLSQTLNQKPRERKAKGEVKGEGEGINYSVPTGTGGSPPLPGLPGGLWPTDDVLPPGPPLPPAAPPAPLEHEKTAKQKTAEEQEKSEVWAALKALLVEQKSAKDVKAAGVLAGKLHSKYKTEIFLVAARETVRLKPTDALTFLVALCETAAGKRLPAPGRPLTDEQRAAANAAADVEAKRLLFGDKPREPEGDVIDA